jgi:beta-mannanase
MIVWEPWIWEEKQSVSLQNIVDGELDNYLEGWITDIKEFEYPVFTLFAPDFNLNGCPWGVDKENFSAPLYRAAYQKIIDKFREEEAYNAIWVWGLSKDNLNEEWENIIGCYPGDSYIDWIAISDNVDNEKDRPLFENLFSGAVKKIKEGFPGKSIMITKTAYGGTQNKFQWIINMKDSLGGVLSDVRMVLWLSDEKNALKRSNVERDLSVRIKKMLKDVFFGDVDQLNTIHVEE